jgi:hypothetical protein
MEKILMNKEQILFKLNAIVRQLTCMNNEEFESHLTENHFEIYFDQFVFSEKSKITTKITMDKQEVNIEE